MDGIRTPREPPPARALSPALSSPAMFSRSPPAGSSLVESLIHACNEVAAMERPTLLQARNVSAAMRRVQLMSSLFQELRERDGPLPPSSVLCLTELLSTIRRAKALVEECATGSVLWCLLQGEAISQKFHGVAKEMGRALDVLPDGLLDLSADTREQLELLQRQVERAGVLVEYPRERWLREQLVHVMEGGSSTGEGHGKGFLDCKVGEIAWEVGLRSASCCEEEIVRLEAEMRRLQAAEGGIVDAVCNIKTLISMVSCWKALAMVFMGGAGDGKDHRPGKPPLLAASSSSSPSLLPDEFLCPITLELMRDPVIITSGHTYERSAIARWLNSGHHTCPKTGRRLAHTALIPNYALRSLIYQWCQENTLPASSSSPSSRSHAAIHYTCAMPAPAEAIKATAEFLVGKLATGSPETQRQAARELRLLAKTGMEPRRLIAEAGAIPFLVTLLGSGDPCAQEDAVTALLNLSIFHNNKRLIVSAGAVDGVVAVLQAGTSTEARENAAATLFSLSMEDHCRAAIGARPGAVHGLLGLLREGSPTGKRDAASALQSLALCSGNRARVVAAGAVPLLVELLADDREGIADDALALLAVLAGSREGVEELARKGGVVVVHMLVDLLGSGTPKGKENAVCVLVGLCRNGGEEVGRRVVRNPRSVTSLQGMVASDGSSPRARRKAEALLRLLNRYC